MSLPTVSVTLTAIDSSGLPVAGARVQAVLDRLEIYQGFVVPNQVNATTDESGVVVLDLFPNALGSNGSAYQVRAWHPETGRRFLDARAVVPNSNCNLDQIIVQEPFPALDAAQQALIAAQGALAPVTAQAQAASASALVAQDAEDGALAAEAAAQGHATEAEASKNAAAQSESNAAASETSAQASAQSASTSAASASASATQAQTAASTATTQATAASQSASSAQASASAAATSQSAAAGSASSAQASATSATASANTSSSAAIAAQLSQTAAAESAIAAKASEDAAEDIATQVAGQVGIATSAANSAAAQAITAAGHASTATTKAAEAADSADLAKDWATMIGSEVMVGHGYSAKQYAQNAAASASQTEADRVQTGLDAAASASSEAVATTQASIATTKADEATSSAALANTKAGEAAGSAAQALAIYGDTTAVQTAVAQAAAQASLAAGYAASASSVVQQDLSGVNAAALHRSPNAVTAMFVYDTSKDSDGGAWTEKCQHTSWYNEPINGKWLGAQISELEARNVGALVSTTELVTNGDFSNGLNNWATVSGLPSVENGQLRLETTTSFCRVTQKLPPCTAGKIYEISFAYSAGTGNTGSLFVTNSGSSASVPPPALSISAQQLTSGVRRAVFTATQEDHWIFLNGQPGSASGTACFFDNISVREVTATTTQTGDYFQLTTDGKFYRLNAGGGTTEVFRGNKRDFPRLAGIVAEAESLSVYDLTEPGRPMFMRFRGGSLNAGVFYTLGASLNSVAALNGVLSVGQITLGLRLIDFTKDRVFGHRGTGNNTFTGLFNGGIALRNSTTVAYDGIRASSTISSANVNAVAMTVLPDAPVDPVTGLKVPTIAVQCGSVVNVIKHDGVVTTAITSSGNNVTFNNKFDVISTGENTGLNFRRSRYPAYNTTITEAASQFAQQTGLYSFAKQGGNAAGGIFASVGFSGRANRISFTKENLAQFTKSTRSEITNTYNTGHMLGDIRRAYLADVDAGSVGPSVELISNGTFDTNVDGWTGADATLAVDSGRMEVNASAPFGGARTTISTVSGLVYTITGRTQAGTSGYSYYISAGTSAGGVNVLNASVAADGQFTFRFTASSSTTHIQLQVGAAGTGFFDDISVKQAVYDRSYKAKAVGVTGTLTKSAVASAAQLVAYSGFSNSNYLREPYSADLDFGTGEWTCSAWVNVPPRYNLLTKTEQLDDAAWTKTNATVTANATTAPDGATTADFFAESATNAQHYARQTYSISASTAYSFTLSVYAKSSNRNLSLAATSASPYAFSGIFDLSAGQWVSAGGASGTGFSYTSRNAENIGNGWWRVSFTFAISTASSQTSINWQPTIAAGTNEIYLGDGTSGIYIWGASLTPANQASLPYQRVNTGTDYDGSTATIVERRHSTGSYIQLGVVEGGKLTATAFDGTTTRTVTTTAAYNTATWLKVRANYRAGRLSIMVNGVEVAVTNGAPLLTLNNSNAVLTIGNSFNLDAPFPGSIALLKFSATVPTAEQSVWMYEQEKQMFREGAQVCLPDSGSIVDLAYDEATDKWIAISAANESEWSGLVRTSVTPVPAGSYSRVSAGGGVQLLARTTTSPGVDVTIPAYGLREELVKRAEAAARINQDVVVFDFDTIGFTAAMTNGSNQVTASSITGTPFVGMAITGTGIPAGTTITGINGTTYTLSANATATGSNAVGQAGFDLPVGYTARVVYSAGAQRREGSTRDYTRLFDGFREQIRFAVTPGSGTWVQIHAVKEAA